MAAAITAVKMKQTAKGILRTESKVNNELGNVLAERASEVKAEQKEEVREHKYQTKAMAQNQLPSNEEAIIVPTPTAHKSSEGAPPIDGLSDDSNSPNAARRAQALAMDRA